MKKTRHKKTVTIPLKEYQRLKNQYQKLGNFLERFERKQDKQTPEKKKAARRLMDKMKKGYALGQLKYKHRSDLHYR